MHDYLNSVLGRRQVLRGAAAAGAAAIAGPVLWRQPAVAAPATPPGPQWLAFGTDPLSEMYLSWSAGSALGHHRAPSAPQVRWGLDSSYGSRSQAAAMRVPVPSSASREPPERTFYNRTLLTGLAAATTYHYSVSDDGRTWGPDTTFTTAHHGAAGFRFTAFGDEATSMASAAPMAKLVASLRPAFHLVAGDLAYATSIGTLLPDTGGFVPSRWDKYLAIVGPSAAQSIPWQAAVGAHETEPLDDHGYAGFVTRLPQAYDLTSGSPVVCAFRYGNVAVIQLDGNDVSAQEPVNAGYTRGQQTQWLARKLAGYRSAKGIDFIVALCNCCCYSTNQTHGSDGGLRDAWGPLFDKYQVDLVISGHVHAYERTNPIRHGQPTRQVAAGGTVNPVTDGTTYICVGGGGNRLYRSWYGSSDAGTAGSSGQPKVWRMTGGDSPRGGRGQPRDYPDPVQGFSAFRRAVYCCLAIDVTPPGSAGQPASMHVRALMPAQTPGAVTAITAPAVLDSVTLTRRPQPASPLPWVLGAAGAAGAVGAAGGTAYVIHRKGKPALADDPAEDLVTAPPAVIDEEFSRPAFSGSHPEASGQPPEPGPGGGYIPAPVPSAGRGTAAEPGAAAEADRGDEPAAPGPPPCGDPPDPA